MSTRWMIRALLIVALGAQAAVAVRLSLWGRDFRRAVSELNDGRAADAARDFELLRNRRPGLPDVGAWQGDAAQAAVDSGSGGIGAAEHAALLDAAWRGYASAVLRSPADSWSWSGLAEVAIRRARDQDNVQGVDLAVIDDRARGVLDPWRAVALGAALRATALKPSGYQELDVLAAVYESMGDVANAFAAYGRSARMMPAPSFHVWGEVPVVTPGLYDLLKRGVDEGIVAAPVYERSLLNVEAGRFAEMNGERAAALAYYEEALRRAGNDWEVFSAAYESSRLLVVLKRFDEALQRIAQADRTGYGPQALRRLRARSLVESGAPEIACAEFLAVLRDSPRDTRLRLDAAQACEVGRQYDLAERILHEGFLAPQDDLEVAKALIDFELRRGRKGTVEDLLRIWIRDYPDVAPLREWAKDAAAAKR